MPITTKVTTNDVGDETVITAEMEDAQRSGAFAPFRAEVVFVAEAERVHYKEATPEPFAKNVNASTIELRWRTSFDRKGERKVFDVVLQCKHGAKGPTGYAWTITSDAESPKKWNAAIGTYYHDTHRCPTQRPKESG